MRLTKTERRFSAFVVVVCLLLLFLPSPVRSSDSGGRYADRDSTDSRRASGGSSVTDLITALPPLQPHLIPAAHEEK